MAYWLWVLLWVFAAGQVHAQSQTTTVSPPAQQLITLETTVNGTKSGTWPFVERLGILYAPKDALEEWRVQVRLNAQPLVVRGTEFWPLAAIPGFTSKMNSADQTLEITFASEAFAETQLARDAAPKLNTSPVLSSAFLNYDLSYSRSNSAGGNSSELGVLTELGYSTGLGVLTSSHVGRHLNGSNEGGPQWLRLETTFTRDIPESNLTLKLGDGTTRSGTWGRNVYFGGIQYGTNYTLTPGFLTQPIPVLTGSSSAASTVELYVNGVLRQVSRVPAGPFVIDDPVSLTGNGEARLVVRDILGRETVLVQPFFTNSQLLAAGLDDWGVEAGALRRGLGTSSADYGPGFMSATWRRGLSDGFTLEGRTELTRRNQVAGLSAVSALPGQVLGRAALVHSRHSATGSGMQWLVGADRQWLQSSMAIQAQGATREFRQLGDPDGLLQTRLQVAGNVAYATQHRGAFGLGFASLQRYDSQRVTTVSANYSLRIGRKGTLTVFATRALSGATGTSLAVSVSFPLDEGGTIGASVASRGGTTDAYVTASRFPTDDKGLGWRVLGGEQQGTAHAEGSLYYSGQRGRLTADMSAGPGQYAIRTGATGGLVLADGHVFATRKVDQSFALAEVAGYGGVGIGLGSNMLARTDAAGIALIPQLSPYRENLIRLDARELPVNAEIDSIEQVVVPRYRSAVKAVFPVRSGRGALVKFTLDDHEPAPAGAIVSIEGDDHEFYVARRGEAFVTGMQAKNRLRLSWKNQSCRMDVELPPAANDEIARIGPFECKGVKR